MSTRDMRKVMKRLEELEIQERKLIDNSEQDDEVKVGLDELQILMGRKTLSRKLNDVRLRIKCLKKNNGIIDQKQNENIVDTTFTLLTANEKKQNAGDPPINSGLSCTKLEHNPKTEDDETSMADINSEDMQFDPQEFVNDRVPLRVSETTFKLSLSDSGHPHQRTSRRMVESNSKVGDEVDQFADAEDRKVKPDTTAAGIEEENLASSLKKDSLKVVPISSASPVRWTQKDQELLEKVKTSQTISSNKHRDGGCVFRRRSCLPAPTSSKGRRSSRKKRSKSSLVQPEVDCTVCNRSPHTIRCTSPTCGLSFQGRLATWCPRHPNNCYLMDHPVSCPACKSPLVEQEFGKEPGTRVLSRKDDVPPTGQPGIRVCRKDDVLAAGQPGIRPCIKELVPAAGQPGIRPCIKGLVPAAGQPGIRPCIKGLVPADGQPGIRPCIKGLVSPAGQPGPLLGLPTASGRGSFIKSGSGESYRERVKRVLRNINN